MTFFKATKIVKFRKQLFLYQLSELLRNFNSMHSDSIALKCRIVYEYFCPIPFQYLTHQWSIKEVRFGEIIFPVVDGYALSYHFSQQDFQIPSLSECECDDENTEPAMSLNDPAGYFQRMFS